MIQTRLDGLDLNDEKWVDMLGPVQNNLIIVYTELPGSALMRHVKMIILCKFILILGNEPSSNANTHLYTPEI